MNVDNPKEFTHISLCAGYGGIDLGLRRALGDVRTIAFSEIEAFACANLVAKMEAGLLEPAPIWTNLKTFPWERFRGKVDVLSGGFPCQPFSSAGHRAGTEDPRHLFPFIREGIRISRPAIIFLENVEGILSAKLKGSGWRDREGTPVLVHVIRELERLGYQAKAGVFSAREIGAPHNRRRVFIMACADSVEQRGRERISRQIDDARPTGICYPMGRGREQHGWEPPRVVEHPNGNGLESKHDPPTPATEATTRTAKRPDPLTMSRGLESSLGGDSNGPPDRLDHAELYQSSDSRVDELRLLGNGVAPDTAARAFRLLWRDLANPFSL